MEPTILSPGYRYRRLHYSPFELTKNPFGHQAWCRHCQMDTDPEIAKGYWEGVDVWRMRCLRCGQIMAYGMDRRLLVGAKPHVVAAASKFIQQTGDDRS